MPFVVLGSFSAVGSALIASGVALHELMHSGVGLAGLPPLIAVMIFFGGIAASIPLSLIVANLILVAIPPVRHELDRNARGVSGGSFNKSMRDLTKAATFISVPAVIVLLLGAVEPWAR
jgi:hypothetical protein